jgi:hypothetical protein
MVRRDLLEVLFHASLIEKLLKYTSFKGCDLGRPPPARTRQIDSKIQCDPAFLDHQHSVSQRDGLGHVMGDEDR